LRPYSSEKRSAATKYAPCNSIHGCGAALLHRHTFTVVIATNQPKPAGANNTGTAEADTATEPSPPGKCGTLKVLSIVKVVADTAKRCRTCRSTVRRAAVPSHPAAAVNRSTTSKRRPAAMSYSNKAGTSRWSPVRVQAVVSRNAPPVNATSWRVRRRR